MPLNLPCWSLYRFIYYSHTNERMAKSCYLSNSHFPSPALVQHPDPKSLQKVGERMFCPKMTPCNWIPASESVQDREEQRGWQALQLKPKTGKLQRRNNQGAQQEIMWLFLGDMLKEKSPPVSFSLLSGTRGLCQVPAQGSSPWSSRGASLEPRYGGQSLPAWRQHWVKLAEAIQRVWPYP